MGFGYMGSEYMGSEYTGSGYMGSEYTGSEYMGSECTGSEYMGSERGRETQRRGGKPHVPYDTNYIYIYIYILYACGGYKKVLSRLGAWLAA